MADHDICGRQRIADEASCRSHRRPTRHRPASDIALTLVSSAITSCTLARIEAGMDDLPLPWVIDLSRLCDLSHPPLRDPIVRVGLVFYPRSGPPASFLDHPSAKAARE